MPHRPCQATEAIFSMAIILSIHYWGLLYLEYLQTEGEPSRKKKKECYTKLRICQKIPRNLSQRIYELIIEVLWTLSLLSLWFWVFDQVINLHMSRQLSCRDMCKIVIWSDHYFFNQEQDALLRDLDHGLINRYWNGYQKQNDGTNSTTKHPCVT